MAWTVPTAIFFIAVFLALAGMAVWERLAPTAVRRGFLPISTTRGDRFFISLLASAFVHAGWLALTDANVLIASLMSLALGFVLMRWG